MGPAGMTEITGRIAGIERRFAPPSPAAFASTFRAAAAAAPVSSPAAAGVSARSPAATPGPAGSSALGAPAGGLVGDWAAGVPPEGRAWAPSIERAALRAEVDPALLASLVWAESGFRPDARSHAGAVGLAQLMPATAAGLGVDPHDPQQNLEGGARYLAEQLRRFGRPELALAAYNAGPARVEAAGGIPAITETQTYVPRVMGYYQQLRGAR